MVMTDPILTKLAKELQMRIGSLPKVEVDEFALPSNPTKSVGVLRVDPVSQTEIVRVVRAARTMKMHVRCYGGSTSFDYALYSDKYNVLMNLKGLCDASRIDIMDMKMRDLTIMSGVRVLAGVTVQELCDFQVQNQVNLVTNVELMDRTVIGAVVSGSHATASREGGSLADQVLQIRIIDCNGDLRTYSDDGTDAGCRRLKTVVANLGLMGVVYDAILRVTPLMTVRVDYDFPKVAAILDDPCELKRRVEENYSTQLLYFPFNSAELDKENGQMDCDAWKAKEDEIMVRTINSVTVATDERQYITQLYEYGPEYSFLEEPTQTPKALSNAHIMNRRQFLDSSVQHLPWAIHCFEPIHTAINEITLTVNTGNNFEDFAQIFHTIQDRLKSFAAQEKFPVNVSIRVNFTGPTTASLCPGRGDQPGQVAHIRMTSVAGTSDWEDWVEDVNAHIIDRISHCTPQWSTDWSGIMGIYPHLEKIYGAGMHEFKKHLEEVDRDGMFMNSKLQQLFFPKLDGYREIYKKAQQLNITRAEKV